MPNEFAPFAHDSAANVMPLANYMAPGFTQRLLGYQTGTAISEQFNRTWRQSSLMTSMIGEFVWDEVALDMLDDGSPAGMTALQDHFRAALVSVAVSAVPTDQWLPISGGTLTGPLTIDGGGGWPIFNMQRQAGQAAQIAGYTAASPRWAIALANTEPEIGGNAGSNFGVARFDDAGGYIDSPLTINRATGAVNFTTAPTVNGDLLPYLPLAGGNLYGAMGAGGTGINYHGVGWGDYMAFGWDGAILAAVNGTYVGHLATQDWVNATHGTAYLPLAGGQVENYLVVNGGLMVNAAAGFRSSVLFGNLGDFINYYDGTNRVRAWASGVYDSWSEPNRYRVWSNANGTYAFLTENADLYTYGRMHAYGGRITSFHDTADPSVSAWGAHLGQCTGFWTSADGMWFGNLDQTGNPLVGRMRLDYAGGLSVQGGLTAGGNAWVSQAVVFRDTSEFAVFGAPNVGVLKFMGGYPQYQQLGIGSWGGLLSYNTQTHPDGGGAWSCDINGNTGQAAAANATGFNVWSDASLKRDIQPWTAGLAAILRINPVRFAWTPEAGLDDAHHVGVTAQEMQRVLPDAVVTTKRYTHKPAMQGGPAINETFHEALAVTSATVLYACVNAIKELAAKVAQLEGSVA